MTTEVKLPKAVRDMAAQTDAALEQETARRQEYRDAISQEPQGALEGVTPQPLPQPPPVPQGEPSETPPPEGEFVSRDAYEQLRQQNNSLQGMYNSQQGVIDELSFQVQQQVHEPHQPVASAGPAYLAHTSAEERELIGDEALEVQSRLATTEANRAAREVEDRVERRLNALEKERANKASLTLWDKVDDLAPGAKSLNGPPPHPDWVAFLNGIDEQSGQPRRKLGDSAYYAGDIYRLASLVDEFHAQHGQPRPNPVVSQRKPETVTAAPGRTGVAHTGPAIRTSEIKAHYDAIAKNPKLAVDPAVLAREQEIEKAWQEGRVIRDTGPMEF